jgi:hypothetical protein
MWDVARAIGEAGGSLAGFRGAAENGIPALPWWGYVLLVLLLIAAGWYGLSRTPNNRR